MSRPSLLWRAILRSERAMPWASAVTAPAPDAQTRARRQRWAVLATVLPSLSIAVVQFLRYRAEVSESWPVWQPMLAQLAVVVAGALIVAAIAFGAVAWRRASL